ENVVLEVDCHSLKISLESIDDSCSLIGGLWHDIMELSRSFSSFKFVWVRREANSVVHSCASVVSSTEHSCFWLDAIPDWLTCLAVGDCTPTSD
uniref:RNase H type-1 domain-containing protein n=1 Tax=Setaria italica TaxID=4555 RepID=K4A083_SETIT